MELQQLLTQVRQSGLDAPHRKLLVGASSFVPHAHMGIIKKDLEAVARISRYLSAISNNLNILSVLINRIFQQHTSYLHDELAMGEWMNLMALDIELFHFKFLSILDCLSQAFACIESEFFENGNRQIYEQGFNALRKCWITRSTKKSALLTSAQSNELYNLLFECVWSDAVRETRNIMTHRPATTIVFPKENGTERVLFSLLNFIDHHKNSAHLAQYPSLCFNENVAYFDSYVGCYISQLIAHMDAVSPYLLEWLGTSGADLVFDGSPTYYVCIDAALSDFRAVKETTD